MRVFHAWLVPALVLIAAVSGAATDQVLLTVDGRPIHQSDLDELYLARFSRGLEAIPKTQREFALPQIREAMMGELVSKTLLLNEADAQGFEVTDEMVETTLQEILSSLPEPTSLEDYALATGQELDHLKGRIRKDLKIRQIVSRIEAAVPEASEKELKLYFDEHPNYFTARPKVRASHILLSGESLDATQWENLRQQALKVREQVLQEGIDRFPQLAEQFSSCSSKARGGDLGQISPGEMVAEFEEAIFSQGLGQVGAPVKTRFGYHLILVTERDEGGPLSFEEAKDQLASHMKRNRCQAAVNSHVSRLQRKAKIEVPQDKGKSTANG